MIAKKLFQKSLICMAPARNRAIVFSTTTMLNFIKTAPEVINLERFKTNSNFKPLWNNP